MGERGCIDAEALLKEAKESAQGESYAILEKGHNYRLGVGVRIDPSGKPSFFLEVLTYICTSPFDIHDLEMRLTFIKELGAMGYTLDCQDGNCISAEATITRRNLESERRAVKAVMERVFKRGLHNQV